MNQIQGVGVGVSASGVRPVLGELEFKLVQLRQELPFKEAKSAIETDGWIAGNSDHLKSFVKTFPLATAEVESVVVLGQIDNHDHYTAFCADGCYRAFPKHPGLKFGTVTTFLVVRTFDFCS